MRIQILGPVTTHEKKIKYILMKVGGGVSESSILVQVAAEGQLVDSSINVPIGVDEHGDVVYEAQNPIIGDSTPIENIFGEGVFKYHTRKFRTSARGKNIAVRIFTDVYDSLSIQSIGYVFKLGKVRE
jgi:hypothetical protein